jgi:hypothetical protein
MALSALSPPSATRRRVLRAALHPIRPEVQLIRARRLLRPGIAVEAAAGCRKDSASNGPKSPCGEACRTPPPSRLACGGFVFAARSAFDILCCRLGDPHRADVHFAAMLVVLPPDRNILVEISCQRSASRRRTPSSSSNSPSRRKTLDNPNSTPPSPPPARVLGPF